MGGRLKNYFSSVYKSVWIQAVLLFIALPAYIYVCLQSGEGMEKPELIIQNGICLIYPVCIILSMTALLHNSVCEKGRELLYLYQRFWIFECMITFMLFLLVMVIQQCFFWSYLEYPLFFFLKNLLMLACFTGICYFSFFTFRSMTPALVFNLIFFIITLTQPFGLFDLLYYDNSWSVSLPAVLYHEKE